MNPSAFIQHQRGLSLLELLITLSLGVVLTGAAMLMFFSSQKTYTVSTNLAANQHAAQYAINLISQEIRNAGYLGLCPQREFPWYKKYPLEGTHQGLPSFYQWEDYNTSSTNDSLFIQHAADSQYFPEEYQNNTPENPTLSLGEQSFSSSTEQHYLISNGRYCDTFTTANNATSSSVTKAEEAPWSTAYIGPFELMRLAHTLFFVGDYQGVSTLYQMRFSYDFNGTPQPLTEDPEPIVPGIVGLQLEYATLECRHCELSEYRTAAEMTATLWPEVMAVKIRVTTEEPKAVQSNNNSRTNTQLRTLESIVSLRNRILP